MSYQLDDWELILCYNHNMTRINLIDPPELNTKHLIAEYRELPRVFSLVKKAQNKQLNPQNIKAPTNYVLGTGHVKFFYDKLKYLQERYILLVKECHHRSYNINPIPIDELINGLDNHWFNPYNPSIDEINLNISRLNDRGANIDFKK